MSSILHPNDTDDVASDISDPGETDADRPSVSWDTPYSGVLRACSRRAMPITFLCSHHITLHSRGCCVRGCVWCVTGVLEPEDMRVWEVLWKTGGGDGQLQRLTFEASLATRALLHKQVEAWSVSLAQQCSDALRNGNMSASRSRAMRFTGGLMRHLSAVPWLYRRTRPNGLRAGKQRLWIRCRPHARGAAAREGQP